MYSRDSRQKATIIESNKPNITVQGHKQYFQSY